MSQVHDVYRRERRGVCIGGPLAGHLLAHHSTRYVVALQPPVPSMARPAESELDKLEPDTLTYKHLMLRGHGKDFGFWVPEDMGVDEALEILANCYSQSMVAKVPS